MMSVEEINQELESVVQGIPGVLHGAAVRLRDSKISDMNELFFRTQETFDRMMQDLAAQKIVDVNTGDTMFQFMSFGFPRMVGIEALDVVFIYVEQINKGFSIRFKFAFQGGSSISYVTTFSI